MPNMRYSFSGLGVTVTFDGKPQAEVLSCLKRNGFRWNPHNGQWWRRKVTGAADALTAIDRLMRPKDAPDGKCWHCEQPGRFRNHGAAAPVLCDRCNEVHAAKRAAIAGN